jgi:hypothetical protein
MNSSYCYYSNSQAACHMMVHGDGTAGQRPAPGALSATWHEANAWHHDDRDDHRLGRIMMTTHDDTISMASRGNAACNDCRQQCSPAWPGRPVGLLLLRHAAATAGQWQVAAVLLPAPSTRRSQLSLRQ